MVRLDRIGTYYYTRWSFGLDMLQAGILLVLRCFGVLWTGRDGGKEAKVTQRSFQQIKL